VSKSSSASPSASPPSGASATNTKVKSKAEKGLVVPETPGTARIIAIANQKGGVGKSTTAVSLGAALADLGFRILVVDLDPQGNASTGIGIRHDNREVTSYDVIVAEAPVEQAIVHSPIKGLDAITSTIDLAGAEIELVSQFSREGRLKRALEPIREGSYDFIFLDCPPSLGLITINALTAAEELIVPIQCEYYALEGLGQLLRNVSLVQQNINQELRLTGIVMTMYDPRTKLSEQVVDEVRRFFGEIVYDNIIPRTVRLSEAPGFGVPITVYDPKSKGAQSYRDLAREVALRPPPDNPMPSFDEMPTITVPNLGGPIATPQAEGEGDDPDVADDLVDDVPAESPETVTPGRAPDADEAPVVAEDAPTRARASAVEGSATTAPRPAAPAPEPQAVRAPAPVAPTEPEADDEIWEAPEATNRVRPAPPSTPGALPERRVVVIDEEAAVIGTDVSPKRGGSMSERPEAIGATLHDDEGPRRRWRLFRKGGE
jgi:chromosome partitioning protein